MSVDGVPAGRVEFELASDLLPVTSENFLRLCNGVTVASAAGEATLLRRQEQAGGGVAAEAEAVEEEEEEEEELGYKGSVVSAASATLVLRMTLYTTPPLRNMLALAPAHKLRSKYN